MISLHAPKVFTVERTSAQAIKGPLESPNKLDEVVSTDSNSLLSDIQPAAPPIDSSFLERGHSTTPPAKKLTLAKGCILGALFFTVSASLGTGIWLGIQHHASSISANSPVNQNSMFGPLLVGNNVSYSTWSIPVLMTGPSFANRTVYSQQNISALRSIVSSETVRPFLTSYVGTTGGAINDNIFTNLDELSNPYIEPAGLPNFNYLRPQKDFFKLFPAEGIPDPFDIRQGTVSDCYLLSSLAALANSKKGRALIENSLFQTSFGAVPTFDLTLFDSKVSDNAPFNVSVSALQIGQNGRPSAAKGGDWVALYEKAFVKLTDYRNNNFAGFSSINGGWPYNAFYALTGEKNALDAGISAHPWWCKGEGLVTCLSQLLRNDAAVVLVTSKDVKVAAANDATELTNSPSQCTIIGTHAYAVLSVNETADAVEVYNPWGFNPCDGKSETGQKGSLYLSVQDVVKSFSSASWI